jgi:hypothetical protein
MLYALLTLVVSALILLLVIYLIKLVLDSLEVDPPMRKVILLLVAICAIIFIFSAFFGTPLYACHTLFCK